MYGRGRSSGKRTGEKIFDLEIDVEDADPRLRPGLSAKITILVEKMDDVVYAPVEAIFHENGKTIAYVKRGRHAEAVEVVCGNSNDKYVVIRDGLEPGDRVLLAQPS